MDAGSAIDGKRCGFGVAVALLTRVARAAAAAVAAAAMLAATRAAGVAAPASKCAPALPLLTLLAPLAARGRSTDACMAAIAAAAAAAAVALEADAGWSSDGVPWTALVKTSDVPAPPPAPAPPRSGGCGGDEVGKESERQPLAPAVVLGRLRLEPGPREGAVPGAAPPTVKSNREGVASTTPVPGAPAKPDGMPRESGRREDGDGKGSAAAEDAGGGARPCGASPIATAPPDTAAAAAPLDDVACVVGKGAGGGGGGAGLPRCASRRADCHAVAWRRL